MWTDAWWLAETQWAKGSISMQYLLSGSSCGKLCIVLLGKPTPPVWHSRFAVSIMLCSANNQKIGVQFLAVKCRGCCPRDCVDFLHVLQIPLSYSYGHGRMAELVGLPQHVSRPCWPLTRMFQCTCDKPHFNLYFLWKGPIFTHRAKILTGPILLTFIHYILKPWAVSGSR